MDIWNLSVGRWEKDNLCALWLASLLELVRSGSQCPLTLSGKMVALVLTAQSLRCLQFLHISCA